MLNNDYRRYIMSKLILIRHGESIWNKMNVFTGWVDVPLSAKGITEAINAGKKLAKLNFDIVFTSVQIRAIQTAMIALAQNKSIKTPVIIHEEGKMKEWTKICNENTANNIIPVYKDWHLNERYYGELQGRNKAETALEFGDAIVHQWRRSYDVPPPNGESLKDTAERTISFFKDTIIPSLQEGNNVMVSAHGNSLRSIVMSIDALSKEEVLSLEIATGKPIIYDYKEGRFSKVK
jgi:2,3-bisphosphoglycerate-dependent phosphoglycerate mutase